tara:strand:+ start:1432 stop:1821 length:390 start_codon:yes stop_codon:yes gene_type:complete
MTDIKLLEQLYRFDYHLDDKELARAEVIVQSLVKNIETRKGPKTIVEIKFEGIDYWNRPVFKDTKSDIRYGDVNNLFSYHEIEELNDKWKKFLEMYKENPHFYLQYFGRSFGCEPNGGLPNNIKLKIVE